jgi:hypothetical protein
MELPVVYLTTLSVSETILYVRELRRIADLVADVQKSRFE